MSWRVEVRTEASRFWSDNRLRFATQQEAEHYAFDTHVRWPAITQTRVLESDQAVNRSYFYGRLEEVQEEAA